MMTVHRTPRMDGEMVTLQRIRLDEALLGEYQREVVELLRELIRIDTTNPPGNETAAAGFLAEWFGRHGLRGEVVGEPAHRRSFVLRLEGRRPGPTLTLLAHTDVVPAEPQCWRVPPFSGEVRDGWVWGRGAGDIKNLVAAHAVAVRRLAAAGRDFAGTVVYAATADEEEGAVAGARWLTTHRPDLVRCDYLLNEGGGEFCVLGGGVRMYELQTGEKGTAQFKLTVAGEAGHASVPLRRGNAVVAAAELARALHVYRPKVSLDAVPARYVELLVHDAGLRRRLLDVSTAREALDELERRDERTARLLEPLYGLTFAPTIVHSSSTAVNVFPRTVELSVDCRLPAGRDKEEALAEIEAAVAGVDADWSLEWIEPVTGNASPYPSRLSAAIETVMDRHVPGCLVVASHCVGFTDSNWFRAAFPEVVAYGFGPYIIEDQESVTDRYHNVDERIHVKDVAFQALFAEELVRELLR
jgi:acetylornithine deacetylase/succinyl-diaminopimelate desuccinylase-like protein